MRLNLVIAHLVAGLVIISPAMGQDESITNSTAGPIGEAVPNCESPVVAVSLINSTQVQASRVRVTHQLTLADGMDSCRFETEVLSGFDPSRVRLIPSGTEPFANASVEIGPPANPDPTLPDTSEDPMPVSDDRPRESRRFLVVIVHRPNSDKGGATSVNLKVSYDYILTKPAWTLAYELSKGDNLRRVMRFYNPTSVDWLGMSNSNLNISLEEDQGTSISAIHEFRVSRVASKSWATVNQTVRASDVFVDSDRIWVDLSGTARTSQPVQATVYVCNKSQTNGLAAGDLTVELDGILPRVRTIALPAIATSATGQLKEIKRDSGATNNSATNNAAPNHFQHVIQGSNSADKGELLIPIGWRDDVDQSSKSRTLSSTTIANRSGRVVELEIREKWTIVFASKKNSGELRFGVTGLAAGVVAESYSFNEPSPQDGDALNPILTIDTMRKSTLELPSPFEAFDLKTLDPINSLQANEDNEFHAEIQEIYREYVKLSAIDTSIAIAQSSRSTAIDRLSRLMTLPRRDDHWRDIRDLRDEISRLDASQRELASKRHALASKLNTLINS